jgi:ABC-type transport system involved in multi-copper enzyme maturation permease subunit
VSAATTAATRPSGWPRGRQVWAVMTWELGRVASWRNTWLLFAGFAPLAIILAHAIHDRNHHLENETLILSAILQIFYVRFSIYFGCLGVFMRLVRGEIAERTLHYVLLAPLRREALVVGKFLAGAVATILVFGTAVLASFVLMYAHFPAGRAFVMNGPGLAHLRLYLLVTVLACLGYGAVLLALSLLFKNPMVPAVVVLLWEGINGALPAWLKHFSVTFYLKPLMPVELPIVGILRLFTVVAEPTPAWLAVSGLVVFTIVVVAFACWRIRRLEISYSTD